MDDLPITEKIQESAPEYRQLLEKLYLLAELKPGKTLYVRTMTVIEHTRINSWYRQWYGEDRFKSLDAITNIIDTTKEYLMKPSTLHEEKKGIIAALYNARDGIRSFLETYKDDTRVSPKVNAILTEIQTISQQHQPIITPWVQLGLLSGRFMGGNIRKVEEKDKEQEDNLSVD